MSCIQRFTSIGDGTSVEEQLLARQDSILSFIDKKTKREYFLFVNYVEQKYIIEQPDYQIYKEYDTKYKAYAYICSVLSNYCIVQSSQVSIETLENITFEEQEFEQVSQEFPEMGVEQLQEVVELKVELRKIPKPVDPLSTIKRGVKVLSSEKEDESTSVFKYLVQFWEWLEQEQELRDLNYIEQIKTSIGDSLLTKRISGKKLTEDDKKSIYERTEKVIQGVSDSRKKQILDKLSEELDWKHQLYENSQVISRGEFLF